VAGGQIKTFALSTVIKINKELHTSMTHRPARLQQAFVMARFHFLSKNSINVLLKRSGFSHGSKCVPLSNITKSAREILLAISFV
jgi:hypothetical protein